jgi:hypothetical protein
LLARCLGIAYFLKGEIKQAAYWFGQAAQLQPDNAGMRRNLDRAMVALGKGAVLAAAGESGKIETIKRNNIEMDESGFYWGE